MLSKLNLMWKLLALIPLALMMAVVFSVTAYLCVMGVFLQVIVSTVKLARRLLFGFCKICWNIGIRFIQYR
jgi:hypothetical protein